MDIRARHWVVVTLIAISLHAAAAVWLLPRPVVLPPVDSGEVVRVTLVTGVYPSAALLLAEPRAESAVAPAAPLLAAARPTVESPVPPEAEVLYPFGPSPEAPATLVAEPAPGPRPEVVKAREPIVPLPYARPRPSPTSESSVAAEAPSSARAQTPASSIEGKAGSRPSGGAPGRLSADGAIVSAPALPGEVADYLARLVAWLDRFKEYPADARRRRVEGTALLVFEMDRDGAVQSYRIARSSGDASLDRAVERMIRRAQPLPAIPHSYPSHRLEVRVPVLFALR